MDMQVMTSTAELTSEIKQMGSELGADLIKVGTVERWTDTVDFDETKVHVYPHTGYTPTDLLPTARTCVMFAVRHLDGVLDTATTSCKTTNAQGNYGYVHLNRSLNDIAFNLAKWLEDQKGYRSLPLGWNTGVRFNHRADDDDTIIDPGYGNFSMKRAAILTGLGRKARNGLVASPEFGTKMRLGCVITAAPVISDMPLEGDPCPTGCTICMRVCPTNAISRDGKVDHLRCFSDVGRRGIRYDQLKESFQKIYPTDRPGVDNHYFENDYNAIDGRGNRACRIACVAFCPLGERRMPDVLRRVRVFRAMVPEVDLQGFPSGR